ncbi:MAG: sulfatase, partial [Pirellulaceae bacterium]
PEQRQRPLPGARAESAPPPRGPGCLAALACIGLLQMLGATPHGVGAEPFHFVLINIDDLGYADVGAFGSTRNRTPHIDRLAREGRRFTSFYAAPVCSPSRSSLMTGCYPKRVGIPQVLFPAGGTGLNRAEWTLPEMLRERGYVTLCVGKWHLGDQPEFLPTRHGFDHYFGIPYSNDMGPEADGARSNFGEPLPGNAPAAGRAKKKARATTHPPLPLLRDETVVERVRGDQQTTLVERYTREAEQFLRTNRDRPFFLYLPHSAVHFPLYPGADFRGKSANGIYGDWVEEVDASVGRIVDLIRALGLADRTLVMFTSDNGGTPRASNAPLRGNKASTWEGGMRVPTIFWWPGKVPAGTTCDAITSMMDVLPTLAGLAEGRLPEQKIDGHDIWPLIGGEQERSLYDVFCYFRGDALEAVRAGDWKLHLKSGMLFNLADDVGETSDISLKHPDRVRELMGAAERIRGDLGDGEAGPGCRAPGRVERPLPSLDQAGRVRAENRGEVGEFP